MKESLKVLQAAAELQQQKSNDYQNPNSRIRQSDYYPRGCSTILDTIYKKFHPEFVYFAKEIIQTENKPKPPQPQGGMPGGPGAGGQPPAPMGAGG